jgi:hypothetical protein
MQLPPLRAFASHVDVLFKPRIYTRYENAGGWCHWGSSDSSLWNSQRYSTNEQNTFHLFPNMWRSLYIGTNQSANHAVAFNSPIINKLQLFSNPVSFVTQIGLRCACCSRGTLLPYRAKPFFCRNLREFNIRQRLYVSGRWIAPAQRCRIY